MSIEIPKNNLSQEIDLPIFGDEDIVSLIQRKERISRLERINWNRIKHEEGIVDEGHVARLAKQLISSRGQLTPCLVRALLDKNGEIYYQVADGFHRDAAFPLAGISYPKATVMYECDDEEFYDLRITAAQNVQPVKFSRMGEWIMTAYVNSKWAKMGYSITQLASLTLLDSSGVKLGLTNEQAEEAKAYILEKANRWGLTSSIFLSNMAVVEKSDPELVRKVRVFSGGKMGLRYLNPSRLRIIADNLPHLYEKQKMVADIVISNNFNQTQTAAVSAAVKLCQIEDISEIKQLFTISDPIEVAKHILDENHVEGYSFGQNRAVSNKKYKEAETKYGRSNNKNNEKQLQTENENLKISLSELGKQLSKVQSTNLTRWWDTLINLTAEERQLLELTLGQGISFDSVVDTLNLTDNQIIKYFISAYTKYRLQMQDSKMDEILRNSKK